MPTCLSTLIPPGGLPEVCLAGGLAVTLTEAIEYLEGHALAAIAVAGAFGILIGWLAKRRAVVDGVAGKPETLTPGFVELGWRHEKLVLLERLQIEKQNRLEAFAEAFAGTDASPGSLGIVPAALRIFVLAERVREARQKVGSDLSRMIAVRDRIDDLVARGERGREALGACRGMAEAQAARLEEARDGLRVISEEVTALEEAVRTGRNPLSDPAAVRRDLMDLKGRILSLPQGWATSAGETDGRIRELLASLNDPSLSPIREILLVDGSHTAYAGEDPGIDLVGGVNEVNLELDRLSASREKKAADEAGQGSSLLGALPASLLSRDPVAVEVPEFGFPDTGRPDSGQGGSIPADSVFRDPGEFARSAPRPSKGFHDLTSEVGNGNGNGGSPDPNPGPNLSAEPVAVSPDEKEGATGEWERSLVLFCSNNVELWGKTVYRGARCRARAISEFPDWARWIAIRRLDTNERVFAPIRSASLKNGQTGDPFGFNGSNELFYGARHLGLFSEHCPNEVETRFTYGGWGFGHRAQIIAPEVEQLQAAGWEGREIPSDTVFEIAIHEELPALGALDRLLESREVSVPR